MEEEGKTRQGNLVHDFVDIRFERALQNLSVDVDQFNCHVFIVEGTCFDADDFAFQWYNFPSLVLFNLRDLVVIFDQLDIGFGSSKYGEWTDYDLKVG